MTRFNDFRIELNNYMKKHCESRRDILNTAISDLINGGGKRLRPIMINIAAGFGNYNKDKIIQLASGIELLHMATLVHDDIIDEGKLRRGRETAQHRFGKNIAVFVGDYLLAKSYILFSNNLSRKGLNSLNKTVRLICEGEIAQFQEKYNYHVTVRDYLKRIRRKTALLFGLSTYLGAYESGLRDNLLHHLYNFGLELGMSFQIQDDLLDFTGDEEKTGKKVGQDMAAGIYTLPVICLLGDGNYQKKAWQLLRQGDFTERDIKQITEMVKESDSLNRSKTMGERFLTRAINHLKSLPAGKPRDDLYYIIDWQSSREK